MDIHDQTTSSTIFLPGRAPALQPPVSVDKNALSSYAASWEGHVEAFSFLSGSDHVRVSLDADGNGWLQVGDSADVLPLPTDPKVAWPPVYAGMTYETTKNTRTNRLLDGFLYPIVGAKVEAARIRFSIAPYAVFATWCTMQTPALDTTVIPSTYKCSKGRFARNPDGHCMTADQTSNSSPIDCGKGLLCLGSVCECDANACKAAKSGAPVTFDGALVDDAGNQLEGSVLVPGDSDNGGPYTVRLKR